MPITSKQLRMIHLMRRDAGLNDPQYRTVLRSVAGVESAKDLDQAGFEQAMAAMEGFGGSERCGTYWQDRQAARENRCGERAVHKIRQLAPQQRYSLEAVILWFTDGRTIDPFELSPREAFELIEMLKDAAAREQKNCQGTEAQNEPDLFGGATAHP